MSASSSQSRKLETRAGVSLHTELWRPTDPPKFVVCLVHGQGEHISRYDTIAAELNAIGGLVFGFDHQGEGRSGGIPGHIERFEQHGDNVLEVLRNFRTELGPELGPDKLPWFIWAHSMGGLITLTYLLDHEREFPLRGVVISAPLLGLTMKVGELKKRALKLFARILPKLAVPTGIPAEAISRDPEQVARYVADPRRVTKITTSWANALEPAIARVEREARNIQLPMHWYLGTGDKICDHEAAEKVFATLPDPKGRDQTLGVWPGYYHELHNEPAALRKPVIDSIHAWILARLGDR